MKRCGLLLGLLLLFCAQNAQAADEVAGGIVIVSIVGAVLGLVIGVIVCLAGSLRRGAKRSLWPTLPLYPLLGAVIAFTGVSQV